MSNILYKFYVSKKQIPWLLGGENIHPTPDIQDSYFNWVKLPDNQQFDFITPFKGEIVVDTDTYTYWKVERFIDNQLDRTFYFYTSRVLTFLKKGFRIELSLDIYLTYTRNIINSLRNQSKSIKINRGTITSKQLLKNNEETKTLIKCLKNVEDNILNGEDTYSLVKPFRWIGVDKTNPKTEMNRFPFKCSSSLTYREQDWGYFNNPPTDNPIGGYWHQYTDGNLRYRSILDNNKVVYIDDEYYLQTTGLNPSTPEPNEKQKKMNDYIGTMFYLESVNRSKISDSDWKEINDNVMNSYFMVFRTKQGYYDCYPIIGKLPVKVRVPSVCIDSNGLPSSSSNHNLTSTNKPVINRVYSNKYTVIDTVLDNDFESIYNDYVNKSLDYTPDSFQGIFRWVYPSGNDSKLCFSVKKYKNVGGNWFPWRQNSNFRFTETNNLTYLHTHTVPQRMLYRMKYSDVSNMFLKDINSKSGYFELVSPDNFFLIENYINLLQPFMIGLNEVVPIKYCFLSKKQGDNLFGYTIPFSYSFSNGFKGFLNTSLYNNPTLSVSFGGTLPVNTDKYDRQLEQIETQKNNGVFSSIGNLISRPINWLSGSFGLSSTTGRLQQKGFLEDFDNEIIEGYGIDKNDWLYGDRIGRISRNFGGNVGGLGGFIGDFISINNTIKQSDVLKRNIGLGYLTSLDDDLLSSISHYNFVKNMTDKPIPLSEGLYTVFGRKLFTDNTKDKYRYYFENFGFNIQDNLNSSYLNDIIEYVNQYNKTGFFQIDKDWCLMNLTDLSTLTDNIVKNSIIDQLSSGIRMRKFV